MLVERFVQAKRLVKSEPAEAVKICTQLLSSQTRIDAAIRVGDVFALLIEHYYDARNYQKAYAFVEQMRDRNIILSPYLSKDMTNTIFKEVGASAESMMAGGSKDADAGDGEVGDDIADEIDSDDLGNFSGSGSDEEYLQPRK